MERKYDVFISHAGEDKESLAVPIYTKLRRRGIRAFLDRPELRVGEDAAEEMVKAIKTALVGLFILSPEFAAKLWPMIELFCFEERAEAVGDHGRSTVSPMLIPVFYRLTVAETRYRLVFQKYPEVSARCGFMARVDKKEADMTKVLDALASLSARTGIECSEGSSSIEGLGDLRKGQGKLVERICDAVGKVLEEKFPRDSTRDRGAKATTGDVFQPTLHTPDEALPLPEDAAHLKGHTRWINAISLLRGGDKIATVSNDRTARVFSLSSKQCLRSFRGHEDDVNGVELIDMDKIVTVSSDGTVRMWRLSNGKLLDTTDLNEGATSCASLGGGRLIIGGGGGGLHELEVKGSQLTHRRTVNDAHRRRIRRIAVHSERFATASVDKTCNIWEAPTLKQICTLTGHTNMVRSVAMSNEFAVTGCDDKKLRVYKSRSFKLVRAINAHTYWIREVQFVQDEYAVLSGSGDGTIAVHLLSSGECRLRVRVGFPVAAVALLPDRRVAVGGGGSSDVEVFSMSIRGDPSHR